MGFLKNRRLAKSPEARCREYRSILESEISKEKELLQDIGLHNAALSSLGPDILNFDEWKIKGPSFKSETSFSGVYYSKDDLIRIFVVNYMSSGKSLQNLPKKKLFDTFIHEVIHRKVYSALNEFRGREDFVEINQKLTDYLNDTGLMDLPTFIWDYYSDPMEVDFRIMRLDNFPESAEYAIRVTAMMVSVGLFSHDKYEPSGEITTRKNLLPKIKKIIAEYESSPGFQRFLEIYLREEKKVLSGVDEFLDSYRTISPDA